MSRRCWRCGRFARVAFVAPRVADIRWTGRFVWKHGQTSHPLSTAL